MSFLPKRPADHPLATICLLIGLTCSGCQWWPDRAGGLLKLPGSDSPGDFPDGPESPSGADPTADDDRATLARAADSQGRSVWIRTVIPPGRQATPGYRWRYPNLEQMLTRPAGQRPDLRRHLRAKDPITSTNVAIALARGGDPAGVERLAEAAGDARINLPMQCAAVESLAMQEGPAVVQHLRNAIDKVALRQARSPGGAQLHAELVRGLARHVDPADDPRFARALGSKSAEVRLAALRAWAGSTRGGLPGEVGRLCGDSNPRIRAAALDAVSRRRDPQAQRILSAALEDHDLDVREAAVIGLGALGGIEAEATLRRLLEDRDEKTRAAAIVALAQVGAKQAVLEAADDKAWRVRQQVARALARFGDADGAAAAGRLLGDPSAVVQQETVRAVARWPLREAGAILLEALASSSFSTRGEAAGALATRWPPAEAFPVDGLPPRRAEALAQLKDRFQRQFGMANRAALAGGTDAAAPGCQQQLDRIEQLVQRQDFDALRAYGPEVVDALEQIVVQRHAVLPEAVFRDVLPRHDESFEVLDRLNNEDVFQRRRAAAELAGLSRRQPLKRLAVDRLAQLVSTETDELVWQSALTAVANNADEPSIRTAYAAIGHPSPEVRRRACQHLAAQPSPRHVPVLLPVLQDRRQAVLLEAVRALGAVGKIGDTAPLRQLLSRRNEEIRLAAAAALTRLGDSAGAAELERLSYSADPKIRRRVAETMGKIPRPAFSATLVRLLDDRVSVVRAALESLPKVVGRDVSIEAVDTPISTSERIRHWKQWSARQTATRTATHGTVGGVTPRQ